MLIITRAMYAVSIFTFLWTFVDDVSRAAKQVGDGAAAGAWRRAHCIPRGARLPAAFRPDILSAFFRSYVFLCESNKAWSVKEARRARCWMVDNGKSKTSAVACSAAAAPRT